MVENTDIHDNAFILLSLPSRTQTHMNLTSAHHKILNLNKPEIYRHKDSYCFLMNSLRVLLHRYSTLCAFKHHILCLVEHHELL